MRKFFYLIENSTGTPANCVFLELIVLKHSVTAAPICSGTMAAHLIYNWLKCYYSLTGTEWWTVVLWCEEWERSNCQNARLFKIQHKYSQHIDLLQNLLLSLSVCICIYLICKHALETRRAHLSARLQVWHSWRWCCEGGEQQQQRRKVAAAEPPEVAHQLHL